MKITYEFLAYESLLKGRLHIKMSKKHFIALADTVRDYRASLEARVKIFQSSHGHGIANNIRTQHAVEDYERFRDALADFCQSQNPNFNRERWLGYIEGTNGPGGGKL